MNYRQALDYLLGFTDFERSGSFSPRPDVAPMRALLRHLGEPQDSRLTVHIAGSKGKGSTAAMVASVLAECGLRVGLYTSPHLHGFCERIQVDGKPISQESFARYATALQQPVESVREEFPERHLVTFDLLTAMAFLAFREAGASAQVVETGLGGRVDSTNALARKDVCVITPVSLEHQAILGDTVHDIAVEKAGIITRGSSVVLANQNRAVAGVIRETCAALGVSLIEASEACRVERGRCGIEGQEFRLTTPRAVYELRLPLLGLHQVENAAAAVLAVEALAEQGLKVSEAQIREGLPKVRWPCRLEVLRRRPLLVVDGAHNGESARRLVETLVGDLGFSRAVFVVGVSLDKDISGMEAELRPLAQKVIATSSLHPRAMAAERVAAAFSQNGLSAETVTPVGAAVEAALAAGEDGLVCVLGSLFVAAEARAHILGIEHEVSTG